MKSRIEDIPKLKTEPSAIDGGRYNQICIGLLHAGGPLRIELPGLRGMDIIIDEAAWVCVDRTLYDLPVLAWTDFNKSSRESLHAPIKCLLHYYHIHAELIKDTVLNTVIKEISKRSNAIDAANTSSVVNITELRRNKR